MRPRAARLATLAGLLLFIALASTAAAATEKVEIQGFAFRPTPLTINAGDTVTWTNRDQAAHSARVVGVGTTPTLSQGQSASLTFTVAGAFTYDCGIHGASMSGSIVVRAATASPPTLAPTSVPTAAPTASQTIAPIVPPTSSIAPTQPPTATASPSPTATASSAATSAAPSGTAAPSVAVAAPTGQAPAPAAANDGGGGAPILIGSAVVAAIAVLAYAVARSRR